MKPESNLFSYYLEHPEEHPGAWSGDDPHAADFFGDSLKFSFSKGLLDEAYGETFSERERMTIQFLGSQICTLRSYVRDKGERELDRRHDTILCDPEKRYFEERLMWMLDRAIDPSMNERERKTMMVFMAKIFSLIDKLEKQK